MDRVPRYLETILNSISKPGRYAGGEFGSVYKEPAGRLRVVVVFPDLYEIGMSNMAVKILYSRLNTCSDVYCERAFAPARDFEKRLQEEGLVLTSLETFTALREFDVICFSVGYELTYTNILSILDAGGVSLLTSDRGPEDPIVMAGGPAVTNPAPMARFVDCFFVGEAEGRVPDLLAGCAALKARGAGREDLLQRILSHRSVWSALKTGGAVRSVWSEFGDSALPPGYPVPSMRVVQDHGVVEIMRGCPNGCRFCHAGIFYRPFRMKEPPVIAEEVEDLVRQCGYREITLSSLSSGDYAGIGDLVRKLNSRYSGLHCSFALPSLRIDSFTLSILGELKQVRKSGLTFAVETPSERGQWGINKTVTLEKTIEILREARELGWRQAKFYFMLGLPVWAGQDEADPIVEFLWEAQRATGMSMHVNVACFIPKPHTPFQWDGQITEQRGTDAIQRIRDGLRGRKFKVSYHAPFTSVLEGIMSRGDGRVGDLILRAYRAGARMDAWEEMLERDIWRGAIRDSDWDVLGETLGAREEDEPLPWDDVDLGVTKRYLLRERSRARESETTSPCSPSCISPCGVCRDGVKARTVKTARDLLLPPYRVDTEHHEVVLLELSKTGRSAFLSHLDTMGVLERSLLRAALFVRFTQGYNPKPRIEFASPLSLGVTSEAEIVRVELLNPLEERELVRRLNAAFPMGMRALRALRLPGTASGKKRPSLMSLFWGSDYEVTAHPSNRTGQTGDQTVDLMDRLYRALEERRREDEAASISQPVRRLSRNGDRIMVRWKRIERKGQGIMRLTAELIGIHPLEAGLCIHRTSVLASAEDGSPVSYFDRMA